MIITRGKNKVALWTPSNRRNMSRWWWF